MNPSLQQNRWWPLLVVVALYFGVATLFAQAPAWWANRGVLLSGPGVVTNDFSLVNQGQVKWLATQAAAEFDETLQFIGGAGTGVTALVASFSTNNNYRPVNAGQLKNTVAPFYARLLELDLTNCYPQGAAVPYPWSGSTNPANDFALVNAGQTKYLFSFDTAVDSDGDGISDMWERNIGSNPFVNDANTVSTNAWAHGLTNLQVFQNPSVLLADGYSTLADGIPDWWKIMYGYGPNTLASTVGANGVTLTASYQGNLDPTSPIKAALDQFNYAQVNLLRWLVNLTPVAWNHTNDSPTRIAQIRTGLETVLTNCLNLTVHVDGLGGTNSVVKWTLATVLEAVGNETGNWLGSSLSLEQVAELLAVLEQLTRVPSEISTTNSGFADADDEEWRADYPETPHFFGSRNVSLNYSSLWPTNWSISTYALFAEKGSVCGWYLDDFLTLNTATNRYSAYSIGNTDITPDWLPNQSNELKAWDYIGTRLYCSDFQIVHGLDVPEIRVDLDVDTDRDGIVDHQSDESGKNAWTMARGALVPPREVSTNSTNSVTGLAKISLQPPLANPPAGMAFRLKLTNDEPVAVLRLLDASGLALGFTNGYHAFPSWPTTGQVFYAASTVTRGFTNNQPKRFTLDLELVQSNTVVISSDRVQLKVAPVILPPDCNLAEAVYSTVVIPELNGLTPLNIVGDVDEIMWTHDLVKFTKVQCDSETMSDVFINLGGAAATNLSAVLRSNGLNGVEWQVGGQGGNIMASPPLPDAPYGKLLIGSKHTNSVPYWTNQNVQPVITNLDTSWLIVGHVDEVIMFVATNKVVFADPWTAADLLHGAITNGNGGNAIWFGVGTSATGTARTVSILQAVVARDANNMFKTNSLLVALSSDTNATNVILAGANNFQSGDILRVDKELMKVQAVYGLTVSVVRARANGSATQHSPGSHVYAYSDMLITNLPVNASWVSSVERIQNLTNILAQALGTNSAVQFEPLPVLFEYRDDWLDKNNESEGPGYAAVTANMVNCLPNWNGVLYYSRTGCDVFENHIAAKLQGLNPVSIDIWDAYHCRFGEIHCGTAARRSISVSPPWWQRTSNWE